MGKRKSESAEEETIRKKIRRLEEKLKNVPRRRRRRALQSESESDAPVAADEDSSSSGVVSARNRRRRRRRRILSPTPSKDSDFSPERRPSPILPVLSETRVTEVQQPVPSTSANADIVEKSPEDLDLDDDILQVLGDAPKAEVALGKAVHKDVASRWLDILSKGLPKDGKEKLLQEYLIPSNCDLLLAPALNLEVKAALPETLVKRDFSLLQKQKQLGVAISALAEATNLILSNEISKQKVLKPISDACRILCDSHFMETRQRRNFVISATNTSMKETLIDAKRDKYLFGENTSEKLKAAKSVQRSGDTLKISSKQNAFTKSNFAYKNNKNRLNSKPQHRKTDSKPTSENFSNRSRPYQRAQPRSYSDARKSGRSPTRRTQKKR